MQVNSALSSVVMNYVWVVWTLEAIYQIKSQEAETLILGDE